MRNVRKNKQVETIYQLRDEMRRLASLPKTDPQPLPVELLDIEQTCTGRLVNVNSATMSVDEMEKYFTRKISQLKGIKREDMQTLHKLCEVFGVEYYIAPGESDRLCAYMYHTNKVDYVMSNDSDMLAYRCNVIKEFSMFAGTYVEFNFNEIVNRLKVTSTTFTDMCILAGTDYTYPVGTIQRMYMVLTREHKNIITICQEASLPDEDIDEILLVRDQWLEFDEFADGIDQYKLVHTMNFDTLVSFIKVHVDASITTMEQSLLRRLVYATVS